MPETSRPLAAGTGRMQEALYHRRQLPGFGNQPEMAAAEDVQARVGDEPVHEMGVGQRDDRVIVAGHDEHRLPQRRQERHAGPAGCGGELIEIAPR